MGPSRRDQCALLIAVISFATQNCEASLVLWRHYAVEESTWEREDTMQATYPFLFKGWRYVV